MKSKFKLNAMALALGAGLIVASAPVLAGVTWFPPVTIFQDDNLEWILKGANNTNAGILEVGDTLVAAIEIAQTEGAFGGGPAGFGGDELTGVAAVTVTGKAFSHILGGVSFYNFSFGPSGNLNAYLTNALPGGVDNATAMVAMYLDGTPDLNLAGNSNCLSMADCIAKATDGTLWQVDGFGASVVGDDLGVDLDNYWLANTADNITTVQGGSSAAKFGVVNFGGSIMYNGTGIADASFDEQSCTPFCAPGGKLDVIGSGDILGGQGLTNGAFARSDFDFQKAVPEPATLALLGLGLLGMASLRKRVR